VYRVELDGSPRLDCEFSFREGDDHLAGGFNITAMRAVNAIPALCRAAPGVVSTFDLPPVTGRGRVG
jgi:4-hydroxy-tetrahydrodipicolinate reductase